MIGILNYAFFPLPYLTDDLDQMSHVRSVLTGDDDTSDPSTTCQTSIPVQIVCLGIGIVNESRESQFQLVLLDMLREALEVSSFH
jgi:hypothetical protein